MMITFSLLLVVLTLLGTLLPRAVEARYQLVQDFSGRSFFNNFDFFTGLDPTHGFAVYPYKCYHDTYAD